MADVAYESSLDELEALMSGDLVLDPVETTDEEELETEDVIDNEDTDLENDTIEDEVDETDTEQEPAEENVDTVEVDENDEVDELEENTQVEDSNLEDNEDDSTQDTADEVVDENNENTEPKSDGEEADTEVVDYKKQYEELLENNGKLQGFYDEITAEFTANGRKMKGLTDPKKIIQSQQMAAGFSDKMSAFKPYRPYMNAIKEEGWLEDPSKFDMAVNVMKGDPEAIKALIKEKELDVLALDMDSINYSGKSHVASNPEIVLDDVMSVARNSGVAKEAEVILSKQWVDDGSLSQLLASPSDAQDFVGHLAKAEDGRSAYDDVQDRIAEKARTDFSGTFGSKSTLEQYKEAAGELEAEYAEKVRQDKLLQVKATQDDAAKKLEEAKAKIATERAEREYKEKVAKETAKAASSRNKAASLSTPKKKAKAKAKFDPIDKSQTLESDELMKYFNENIMGRSY